MPGKRDVFQKKYIGKDYVAYGNGLILNKDLAWKRISRRARRSILAAQAVPGLEIKRVAGTKEDVDLFRTVWYKPDDSDLSLGGGGFKSNWRGWFAYLNGKFVAGTIVGEVDNILFLWFNGASEEAKKLQIPSLMIWNAVLEYHNSRFKYLDVGCSFRPALQEFFRNWATYKYPTIYHAPDLAPQIDVTPFGAQSMAVLPDAGIDVDELLSKKFNGRSFTHFPRGKYAIFSVLKHLRLAPDDEIFITTTTGSPYLSIGVSTTVEEICKWSRKISDKTKAVLLIHEFGFLHPKRAEIKAMCQARGVPLIEDCAYAWNSGDAGSYGDYVIYSLPKFFPVQYGGILVGAHFDDKHIWDNFYCLDPDKRKVTKEQLSSYLPAERQAALKRIENYKYLEKLSGTEGFSPFFQLQEGEVPAIFMLKVSSEEKMKEISGRLKHFGIECGAYYHNSAVFLPIHQNLSAGHLNYMYGAIRSLYREGCGVYPPEYFTNITQTKKGDRNDTAEDGWGQKQTKESINEYAKRYDTTVDFDRYFIDFRFRCLKEHYPFLGDALELGSANGLMSKNFLGISNSLDIIEGSEHYISETKKYLGDNPRLRIFHNLFSDFKPDKKYDTIILSSILHEVDEPVPLLEKMKGWLRDGGTIYINVPNALSLHRRVGKLAGMMKSEYEFNERDKTYRHQRIYDLNKLEKDVESAGLKIIKKGGYFLKPLSNGQMEKLDKKLINAFYEISKDAPAESCAEIFIFATL